MIKKYFHKISWHHDLAKQWDFSSDPTLSPSLPATLNMYFNFWGCLGLLMKKITVSKVAQGMVASAQQKLKEPRPEEPQQILYTNADILKISEEYSAST